MTVLTLVEPTLTERVTQWAQVTNRATDDVLEEAVQTYFGSLPVLIAPLLPPPPREIRRLGGATGTEVVD